MKQPNKVGGGAKTNINGLHFEQTTDFREVFEAHPDFEVKRDSIYKHGKMVALLCGKHDLYRNILDPKGINYREIISRKLVPDEALLVDDTVYIIEKKFQNCHGSVDEKLQTCDFKNRQYFKLLSRAGYKVVYIYLLNDWFKREEYRNVLEYIESVGCKFFFNEIPLEELGL